MKIPGRLRTLLWYLRNPRYYAQFARDLESILRRSLGVDSHHEYSSDEAAAWCASRSVDTRRAIELVTGLPPEGDIRDRYREVFAKADAAASVCPVHMGGAGNLDLLYWITLRRGASKVMETGVAYGWSALAILLALQGRAGARLISTDMPYPGRENDSYVGCVVPAELRRAWTLLRFADREGIPRGLRECGSIELCHYDSDKSYASRVWAYPRLWSALRPSGVLLSDDVSDNTAFRDFAATIGVEPIIVETAGKYAGVLVKPKSAPPQP